MPPICRATTPNGIYLMSTLTPGISALQFQRFSAHGALSHSEV